MKWFNKFLCILLSMICLVSFSMNTNANEALQIKIDRYAAEDGVLKLYINHNKGEGFSVNTGDIKVLLGNNEMITQKVSTLLEENVPISYKCVVDVSGSMSQERIDQAKKVIKDLARLKKPEDNIAITALGNELIQSDYMTDSLEIADKADILKLTKEDTNLYYALVEEIKGLQTVDEVGRKRCLIIFSDGADDQAKGITREEAEKAVIESRIPVFTVGLLKSKNSDTAKEMAKILGSFARISSGGQHFVPELGEGNLEDIAKTIVTGLNSSLVIEESLENINVEGKEVVLKISLSTDNGETAEDAMNVPESDIKIIKEEKIKVYGEPEVDVDIVTEEVVEEATVEKNIWDQYGLYIILAAVLLVIFIVIVIILIINKNKESKKYSGEEIQDSSLQAIPVDDSHTIAGFNNEGLTVAPIMPNLTQNIKSKKYTVTLVQLGKSPEKKYNIDLLDKCTIGRSSTKNTLGIPTDTALSEIHASILVEKENVYLKDEKSTNGTFVNGVPITGKFLLNQDDVILIGSYEYRISWK